MEKVVDEKPMTNEELKLRKKELIQFYTEQSEFLKIQLNFEALSADVEEAKLRRMIAIVRMANLVNPKEEVEEPNT